MLLGVAAHPCYYAPRRRCIHRLRWCMVLPAMCSASCTDTWVSGTVARGTELGYGGTATSDVLGGDNCTAPRCEASGTTELGCHGTKASGTELVCGGTKASGTELVCGGTKASGTELVCGGTKASGTELGHGPATTSDVLGGDEARWTQGAHYHASRGGAPW
eukprot:556529-Rhodomonas_salina.1